LHANQFTQFLNNDDEISAGYRYRIQLVLNKQSVSRYRIIIDIGDLRAYNSNAARRLLRTPHEILPHYEEALRDYAQNQLHMIKPKEIKDNAEKFIANLRLGFTGHFGFHHIKPHELLCHFLSSMIRIDGVVTKSSSVTPKLKVSVHLCPVCRKSSFYDLFFLRL
jgi:DNA replication licensing factor MCM3